MVLRNKGLSSCPVCKLYRKEKLQGLKLKLYRVFYKKQIANNFFGINRNPLLVNKKCFKLVARAYIHSFTKSNLIGLTCYFSINLNYIKIYFGFGIFKIICFYSQPLTKTEWSCPREMGCMRRRSCWKSGTIRDGFSTTWNGKVGGWRTARGSRRKIFLTTDWYTLSTKCSKARRPTNVVQNRKIDPSQWYVAKINFKLKVLDFKQFIRTSRKFSLLIVHHNLQKDNERNRSRSPMASKGKGSKDADSRLSASSESEESEDEVSSFKDKPSPSKKDKEAVKRKAEMKWA